MLAACLLLLAGCYTVDETDDPMAAGVVNHRLLLRREAFVWRGPADPTTPEIVPVRTTIDMPRYLATLLTDATSFGGKPIPPSIAAWRANRAAYSGIEEALPPGTALRIVRVERQVNFEDGTLWFIWGRCEAGASADESLLLNELFILPRSDDDLLLVVPALLEVED